MGTPLFEILSNFERQGRLLSIASHTFSMHPFLVQEVPGISMLSLQQVEASLLQDAVPASTMLSLQQVEAEQAAQQLLQDQPQGPASAVDSHDSFGSVQFASGFGAVGPSDSAADGGESSQVLPRKSVFYNQIYPDACLQTSNNVQPFVLHVSK